MKRARKHLLTKAALVALTITAATGGAANAEWAPIPKPLPKPTTSQTSMVSDGPAPSMASRAGIRW